jgi:hypothetical protein
MAASGLSEETRVKTMQDKFILIQQEVFMKRFTTGLSALLLSAFLLTTACAQTDSSAGTAKKPSTAAKTSKATAAVKKDAAPSTAAKPLKAADTLVVVARITEIAGKFAPNDLYNYVYIMKYRVLNVVKGVYKGQDILVGHYNPLIPRAQIKDAMKKYVSGNVEKFEVGAKHRLTLIAPIDRVWKDAVDDEYPDSDQEKYYALKAEIVQ